MQTEDDSELSDWQEDLQKWRMFVALTAAKVMAGPMSIEAAAAEARARGTVEAEKG